MAIKIPKKFQNFLLKKLKKFDLSNYNFRENLIEFVEEFIEKSNENMIGVLIDYLDKKSNRESIKRNSCFQGNVFNVLINEQKQRIKSNSEIIITPIKNLIKKDYFSAKYNEDIIELESIDQKKLFFVDTQPLEMTKIMNHIDDLVEENHLKNSLITVVYDSDEVIPETPIKNYIGETLLENIRFSPHVLDAFEKSPIKTPNKLCLSNDNDSSSLLTPDQKSNESSFKFAKPTKEFETVTSSPKQISSFNSKLKKNNIKEVKLPDLNQSPIINNNDIIMIENNKQENKIKPITFNKRLSMFLRKDANTVEAAKEVENEVKVITRKRGLVQQNETITISDDDDDDDTEKSNKIVNTSNSKRKLSNMPEIIKALAENANKSFSSEIESFDDSDLDLTYGKNDKNKFNKRKTKKASNVIERITPEKSRKFEKYI
jgi:hypothetical protein